MQEIILFIIQTNGGGFFKKIHFRKELVRFGSLYIKRSKYSSAYRLGFSVSKKGSFAQVHRIKTQNVVHSVMIGE